MPLKFLALRANYLKHYLHIDFIFINLKSPKARL